MIQHVVRNILLVVALLGVVLVMYLFSQKEIFPLQSYEMASVSAGESYDPTTRADHVARQSARSSPDGTIRYIDQGSGDVILLLHGTPTSSWMYRKVIPLLVDQGYRVIAPDMMGYGSSDKPTGNHLYTEKKQADRIVGLMDHLGIGSWHHVMHDIGGLWTWELLMSDADRIKSLISLNTIVDAAGFHPPGMMKSRPAIGHAFTKLITVDLFSRMIMTSTITMMVTDSSLITTDVVNGYLYPTMQGQWRVYGYFMSSLGDIDDKLTAYHQRWKDNHNTLPPLRVIRGAQDANLSPSQTQTLQMYRGLDHDAITIWDDVGHLVAEERPKELSDVIRSFIREYATLGTSDSSE